MKVTLEVTSDIEPTAEERRTALRDYQPTALSPTADEEWICEEVAMNRINTPTDIRVLRVA